MKRALLSFSLLLLAGIVVGPPSASAAQPVDLTLYYDAPAVPAGGSATQTFTVVDSGPSATGPAQLTITTGAFVTVPTLPTGCGFLYQDADSDPTVPSVVRCAVPGLPPGGSVDLRLPVSAAAGATAGETYGAATLLPTGGVADQHLADNIGWPSVLVTDPVAAVPPVTARAADLYLTTDLPAVAVGSPAAETLTVGNRGPQAGAGPVRLVVVTPPLVRAGALPAGCAFRYDSPDPGAPQVIGCSLAPLPVGATTAVRLPLAPAFGSPVQTSWGVADAFPDRAAGSTDVDPVPANNFVESGVQVIG